MVVQAGLASDEHGIAASEMNQTHIGLAFGTNFDDGTVVYGRIAGFHIGPDDVVVHLDGVASGDDYSCITLEHHEKVYFTHYSRENEQTNLLQAIEKNTTPKKA
jgi:hypothetical protein